MGLLTDTRVICERCHHMQPLKDFTPRDQLTAAYADIKLPAGWQRHGPRTYCGPCWRWVEYESRRT